MTAATLAKRPTVAEPVSPGSPAPLYVVCSPTPRVGKTLLARLLHDHYRANNRAVTAFDLDDESPRLADFIPDAAHTVDIGDLPGQMAFFDGLIAGNDVPKIVDVGHREFATFFTVAQKISLFEEARRRGSEPVLLFMIDPEPTAERAYAMLRHWFSGFSLLPVRNLTVAKGLPYGAAFRHASTLEVSIEIPALGPSAQSLIERERFSFIQALTQPPGSSKSRRDGELRNWARRIGFQFREIELGLIREQILAALR
jgi:hypothetical protein